MNLLSPFLTLNCSCDEALEWSSQNLTKIGMRVIQTFDLLAARHTVEDCPCPHHQTSECNCQMLILLVYGDEAEPTTLILHGNDGLTWVSIVAVPNQEINVNTEAAIKQALNVKLPTQISSRV